MIRVLNLGAGVQSSTVLLMSYHGELPLLDAAIFADTQWEPKAVYEHLEWLKQEVGHKIPIHVVMKGDIRADALKSEMRGTNRKTGTGWISMPFFIKGAKGEGLITRQCTTEYKITPIANFIRRNFLNLRLHQRAPKTPVLEAWYGISIDEVYRLRTSPEKWKVNEYPLCGMPYEYLSRRYSRQDCREWFAKRYPGRELPRSACIGCPYHSNSEWREIKGDEWQDAVEFDNAMRNKGGNRGQIFLHRSLKPLEDVDLRTAEDKGQGNLWNNECQGMCGV